MAGIDIVGHIPSQVLERLEPQNEQEACAIVKQARLDRWSLSIEGGGTRAGLGRPIKTDEIGRAHV